MPKVRCICKKHSANWLPSQRFYLARILKGLPHEEFDQKATIQQESKYDPIPAVKVVDIDSFASFQIRFRQEIMRHKEGVITRNMHRL